MALVIFLAAMPSQAALARNIAGNVLAVESGEFDRIERIVTYEGDARFRSFGAGARTLVGCANHAIATPATT